MVFTSDVFTSKCNSTYRNRWESSANTNNIGARFVIDVDKDGTTYQIISLKKYTNYVGKLRSRYILTKFCDCVTIP
jgi:hypothetical protein